MDFDNINDAIKWVNKSMGLPPYGSSYVYERRNNGETHSHNKDTHLLATYERTIFTSKEFDVLAQFAKCWICNKNRYSRYVVLDHTANDVHVRYFIRNGESASEEY